MVQRKYLFTGVIELNLQAAQSFGVNIYLIDGGSEWAIIDVGQVKDMRQLIAFVSEITPQNIPEQKRSKIPDVREIPDRWPADIHAHTVIFKRMKFLDLSG